MLSNKILDMSKKYSKICLFIEKTYISVIRVNRKEVT